MDERPDDEYQPGSCNIGPADVRARARLGQVGVAVALLVAVLVASFASSPWWALLVAPPAYAGATGLLQARARFCVGFAAAGRYGFGASRGPTGRVTDEAARAADRERARRLNSSAARWTIAVTALAVLLTALAR